MSDRVLATDAARRAAAQYRLRLRDVIDAQQQVLQSGLKLCDPAIWDGPMAKEFRTVHWPPAQRALRGSLAALNRLQAGAETVVSEILRAGTDATLAGATRASHPLHPLRPPDYVVLNVSGGFYFPLGELGIGLGPLMGMDVAYSRTGHLYVGPELGLGVGNPGPVSLSPAMRAGWIGDALPGHDPTSEQVDDFPGQSVALGGATPGLATVRPSVAVVYGTPGRFRPWSFGSELGLVQTSSWTITGTFSTMAKPGEKVWWSPVQWLPAFDGPHW